MANPKVIDAEFDVVDGPYRVGDEHRERRGWFLTDKIGKHGEPLWYKPPSRVWVWIRRACYAIWFGCIALGVLGMILGEFL